MGFFLRSDMNFLGHLIQTAKPPGVETGGDRHTSGWDGAETPGTSGGERGTNGARWGMYAAIAGVSLVFALVNAFSAAHDAVRGGAAYNLRLPLLWELTSAVVIVGLSPLIGLGVRRMRRGIGWPLRALWAAGTILTFSALHVAGMVVLRKLALATVGGSYSFGFSVSEFTYELRKDIVTCFMIGAAFWLAIARREALADATAAVSATTPSPDVLWLRDGSARIRIEPRDIVGVSSAGNYVEYSLTGGRTHLVRGTLAAEESRLTKFNIVRVHRTRLVSLFRVTGLRAGGSGDFELTLDTGDVIPGSRRYRAAITSIEGLAANSAAVPTAPETHP
jgi:hypothetical protein